MALLFVTFDIYIRVVELRKTRIAFSSIYMLASDASRVMAFMSLEGCIDSYKPLFMDTKQPLPNALFEIINYLFYHFTGML